MNYFRKQQSQYQRKQKTYQNGPECVNKGIPYRLPESGIGKYRNVIVKPYEFFPVKTVHFKKEYNKFSSRGPHT